MESTKQFVGPKQSSGEEFAAAVMDAAEPLEEKYGQDFYNWFQPMQGEFVEEFTDIKWVAVQMLLYWASDTGEPFETCSRRFLRQFKAELQNLRNQGLESKCFLPLENWRFHLPPDSKGEQQLKKELWGEEEHGLGTNRKIVRSEVEALERAILSATDTAKLLGVGWERFMDLCEAAWDVPFP